jgi:hypothetical protein
MRSNSMPLQGARARALSHTLAHSLTFSPVPPSIPLEHGRPIPRWRVLKRRRKLRQHDKQGQTSKRRRRRTRKTGTMPLLGTARGQRSPQRSETEPNKLKKRRLHRRKCKPQPAPKWNGKGKWTMHPNGAVHVFDRNLHLRMQLVPWLRLKLLQACDQWHSSRCPLPLTGLHCTLHQTLKAEGNRSTLLP